MRGTLLPGSWCGCERDYAKMRRAKRAYPSHRAQRFAEVSCPRAVVDSEPQSHGRAVDRTKLDSRSEVRRAVRERAVFGGGDALMPQRSSCVDSSVCSSRYSCRVASKYAHRSGVLAISASAVRPSRARGPWLDAEPPGGGAGLPGGADEKPQPRPGRPEHSLSAMVPRQRVRTPNP